MLQSYLKYKLEIIHMETSALNQKSQQKPTFKPKTIRIITTQEQTFADSFINIPTSQLNIINKIIN